MTAEEIYQVALKKQMMAIESNKDVEFYKTFEYLEMLVEDIVKSLQFTKYCSEQSASIVQNQKNGVYN